MASEEGSDAPHVSRHAESKIAMRLMLIAEKHCSQLIKDYNECAKGRSFSMLWACRTAYFKSQECVHQYLNEDNIDRVKRRWIEAGRPRKPNWEELLAGMDQPPASQPGKT